MDVGIALVMLGGTPGANNRGDYSKRPKSYSQIPFLQNMDPMSAQKLLQAKLKSLGLVWPLFTALRA